MGNTLSECSTQTFVLAEGSDRRVNEALEPSRGSSSVLGTATQRKSCRFAQEDGRRERKGNQQRLLSYNWISGKLPHWRRSWERVWRIRIWAQIIPSGIFFAGPWLLKSGPPFSTARLSSLSSHKRPCALLRGYLIPRLGTDRHSLY